MSSFFDEIAAKLAQLSGVATPEVSRDELNEFNVRDIQAVRVSEGGGGGGGNVPFVGVNPPDSPTDGMLWWDPDDDTPSGELQGSLHSVVIEQTLGAQTPGTLTASLEVAAGAILVDMMFYALVAPWEADAAQLTAGDNLNENAYIDAGQSPPTLLALGNLDPSYEVGGGSGFYSSGGANGGQYALLSGNQWFTRYTDGGTISAFVNTAYSSPVTPAGQLLVVWWIIGNAVGDPTVTFEATP